MKKYYYLKFGEIIKEGDEVEMSNSFNDPPKWEKTRMALVGTTAPDPHYPAHRQYRRSLENKCPKCGGRLSFGLSDDKWACTVCGLMSRDYYADAEEKK